MGNIGLILRADPELDTLPENWTPEPLGLRSEVIAVLQRHIPADNSALALEAKIEPAEANPLCVRMYGVWGEQERAVLKALCEHFSARFYDSEECGFIDL